jgi:hypothetical protein
MSGYSIDFGTAESGIGSLTGLPLEQIGLAYFRQDGSRISMGALKDLDFNLKNPVPPPSCLGPPGRR